MPITPDDPRIPAIQLLIGDAPAADRARLLRMACRDLDITTRDDDGSVYYRLRLLSDCCKVALDDVDGSSGLGAIATQRLRERLKNMQDQISTTLMMKFK